MTGLTLAIPAHASWPVLERTLTAALLDLGRLDLPSQVIVVDNDSPTPLAPAVHSLGRPTAVRDVRVLRRGPLSSPFEPGAARNLAIEAAWFDDLVFLDADSIPAPHLFERYAELLGSRHDTVFIGHREFVDARFFSSQGIALDRTVLERLPRIGSESNYGEARDRRFEELLALDEHPMPYNCLFGCNFAVKRSLIGRARFRPEFDGHWGYEDIEFGYQLHEAGAHFEYVREASVYHQEGSTLTSAERERGKRRNFELATRLIPGFLDYRRSSTRVGSTPQLTSRE